MGFWTANHNDPVNRGAYGGRGAIGVVSGVAYCYAGMDSFSSADLSDVHAYNPATNTWTAKASGITSEEHAAGVIGSGTIVWFVAGAAGAFSTARNTARPYNTVANTWGTNITTPLSGWTDIDYTSTPTAIWLISGVTGLGMAGSTANYSFNGTTFTSKAVVPAQIPDAPTAIEAPGVVGTIHVVGGYNIAGAGNSLTTHRTYSVSGNTWSTKAAYTAGCAYSAGEAVPGAAAGLWVFGGVNAAFNNIKSPMVWKAATNAWTSYSPAIPNSEPPRTDYGQHCVIGNTLWWESSDNAAPGWIQGWNADTAPSAPTLTAPAAGAAVDATSPVTFTWTFVDPDSGDAQAAFALQVTDVTAGTTSYWNVGTQALQATEVWNTGSAGSVTLPANILTNTHSYSWAVRTQDTYGPLNGPYAAARTLVASSTPTTTITAPFGVVTSLTTQRVYWVYSQAAGLAQSNYQVKVFTKAVHDAVGFDPNTSATVWDSGQVASAATSVGLQGLTDAGQFYVYVRTASAGPNWSPWASSAFSTDTTRPLGVATRLIQTVEYVYQQLTSQAGRPAPDVDTDANVQNAQQPATRMALGATDYTPTGTESGGILPGEISNGGTLDSVVAGAISHTTGTASYTLQQVWTADQAYNVYTVGVLNNMSYRMAPGQPGYVAGSANQRRLIFAFRLPNAPVVATTGDSFETDVTVTY